MAGLRGYDGKIVIDEREAREDMKKIDEAAAKLAKARELLDPGRIDANSMAGRLRAPLDEQLNKIRNDLNRMEAECKDTSGFIGKVVEKYKRIDAEVAKQIRGKR